MRVLEVYLNGKKLCVAGFSGSSITASVSSVLDQNFDDCFCYVAGSIGSEGDFAKWVDQKRLKIGDDITIKVRESESADAPASVEKARRTE